MNIFQKIKIAWQAKKVIEETVKEATTMDGIKPGWKTTEFWLTVLTNVTAVVGALKGIIPDQAAAIIIAAANGVYGVVRAITKA